jgi:lipid II:glycine glycyltransferase (peptidoglycan interpeptide bridge formation enzyme)
MPEISLPEWDAFINRLPDVHILQTSAWGRLKQVFAWQARYICGDGKNGPPLGAQVLFRRLPFGFHIAYIPKGPVGWKLENDQDWLAWSDFLEAVDTICRKLNAIFLILEPDLLTENLSAPPKGFSTGIHPIQPMRTLVVDLSGSEQDVLARMKQKTRYNIRLAQKKGVTVESSQDLDTFYRLMTMTGRRDAFGIHSLDYYREAFHIFYSLEECELLIARFQGEPLAGLMVFRHGRRSWYFYGASSDAHRDLMATYLIQWEAMRWAMRLGCTEYDLWGVPDEDENVLEAEFNSRSEDLWGVYRFKRGFGGALHRSAGPFEQVYRPNLFRIYTNMLKFRRQTPG